MSRHVKKIGPGLDFLFGWDGVEASFFGMVIEDVIENGEVVSEKVVLSVGAKLECKKGVLVRDTISEPANLASRLAEAGKQAGLTADQQEDIQVYISEFSGVLANEKIARGSGRTELQKQLGSMFEEALDLEPIPDRVQGRRPRPDMDESPPARGSVVIDYCNLRYVVSWNPYKLQDEVVHHRGTISEVSSGHVIDYEITLTEVEDGWTLVGIAKKGIRWASLTEVQADLIARAILGKQESLAVCRVDEGNDLDWHYHVSELETVQD